MIGYSLYYVTVLLVLGLMVRPLRYNADPFR